jgi:Kef-type K+ transport system membrane component KefB
VDAVVGIGALQVVYALFPPGDLGVGLPLLYRLTWLVAGLGLGAISGILFLWLTRPRPGGEEMILFLLGIAAFAGGAALQLQLSPLFVSVTMGAVVANASPDPQRVYRVLHSWEKPIYVVLLLMAGAILEFSTPWILVLALAYAVVRGMGKVLGSYVMLRILPLPFETPRRFGLGLIPQGGISLAMVISGVLTYGGLTLNGRDAAALLFAVVVLGVVFSELAGPFLTRNILQRAGEIAPYVEESVAKGKTSRGSASLSRDG